MNISLTQAAAEHISGVIKKRGNGIGFKLAVKDTGCSGYSYVMGIAEEIHADDEVLTSQGIQLVIPKASLQYLQGTEIDLESRGLNRKLIFNNPQAVDACGCGESFSLKEE